MKFKKFAKSHKYSIVLFVAFSVVAIISGYFVFIGDNVVDVKNIQIVGDNEEEKIENEIEIKNVTSNEEEEIEIKTETEIEEAEDVQDVENNIYATLIVLGKEYEARIMEGSTVYEAMQALTASSIQPFLFSGREYSGLGFFVEEINGVKNNNETGEYWIYYINGEKAKLGISNYILKEGDLIEWKYEKSKI